MKKLLSTFQSLDSGVSRAFLRLIPERNSLLTFLFHGIFLDKKEIARNLVDPQQSITSRDLRGFIEYYLGQDYKFVSPTEVIKGLSADNKYLMLTFDDGYFNHRHVLPLLKEYNIPAVFFISTKQVIENKSFWWDIVYRERLKQGRALASILREQKGLKLLTAVGIEEYLIKNFGADSMRPRSEIDRPFTPDELREFSRQEYVYLGNHTHDHAILTNYSAEGIRGQLLECQNNLIKLAGIKPKIISYPDGAYSEDVINITREAGFKIGVTVDSRKNYLPINTEQGGALRLGRFILNADKGVISQAKTFRSDLVFYHRLKNLIKT